MDIEATMQFVLDQQAQFSSDVARINSVLQRTSEIVAALAEGQITTEETTQRLAERQNKFEQTILEVGQTLLDVANAQKRTNEILVTLAKRQVATEEAISRLAERQGTTEENLNLLLLTVERHIANHN